MLKEVAMIVCLDIFLIGMSLVILKSMIQRKIRCTEKVIGEVTYLKYEDSGDDGTVCFPYFYYIYQGRRYDVKSNVSSNSLGVGDKVEIYIDPNDPEFFYVPKTNKTGIFMISIMLLLAIIFTSAYINKR